MTEIAELRRLVDERPSDGRLRLRLGAELFEAGLLHECGNVLKEARRLDPALEGEASYLLARSYLARDLPADKVISVMGCIVNGPGEAKAADLGIAAGRTKVAIYRDGELHRNIEKDDLEAVLVEEIERLKK